jgi:hypothetical protein
MRPILLAFALSLVAPGLAQGQPPLVRPAEILEAPEDYFGKLVLVRGRIAALEGTAGFRFAAAAPYTTPDLLVLWPRAPLRPVAPGDLVWVVGIVRQYAPPQLALDFAWFQPLDVDLGLGVPPVVMTLMLYDAAGRPLLPPGDYQPRRIIRP